jgi:homoserine kinase
MTTVRVTVPATSANLGPGFDSMALALGMYNVVELSEIDHGLEFDLQGEGVNSLARDAGNMVVQAAKSVFRRAGRAPGGLYVRLENNIPPGSGMGSSAAALLGGVVAANIILGNPLQRDEMLQVAIDLEGHANSIVAALCGGLVASSYEKGRLVYASLPVAPMHVVVVLPDVKISGARSRVPQSVALADAVFNIGRSALVMHALGTGDFDLLSAALADRLHEPTQREWIPGFEKAVEAARLYGASAVAVSGSGPALIAFAPDDHEAIAKAMERALHAATQAEVRSWILPVDTQGISISEMGVFMPSDERRAAAVPASDTPVAWPFEDAGSHAQASPGGSGPGSAPRMQEGSPGEETIDAAVGG